MASVSVANFYLFVQLSNEQLEALRVNLEAWAQRTQSLGLVVLATEGINATLSGKQIDVEEGLRLIETTASVTLNPKWSQAYKAPFRRFKIDLRDEIVTLGFSCAEHRSREDSFLTPAQWHARLSQTDIESKPVVIDLRNAYETRIGTFAGSIDPKFDMFTDLISYAEEHPELKAKELMIFCTGGIRCEKAVPYLESKGFNNVKQLHGGILKYIEEFPDGQFKGECFVFDHRVSVDQNLQPTKRYWLCPLCGDPGDVALTCSECGREARICADCESAKVCSKNCHHHAQRKAERRGACLA